MVTRHEQEKSQKIANTTTPVPLVVLYDEMSNGNHFYGNAVGIESLSFDTRNDG